MEGETLIRFLIETLFSPAGFIGFCCGLSRSLPAILGGAIAATALETFLAFAVATEGVDPLSVLVTPVAALFASGVAWGAARLFFGPKTGAQQPQHNEGLRIAYKDDLMEPNAAEDFQ